MQKHIEDIESQIEIQRNIIGYGKSYINLIDQFLLDLKYTLKRFLKQEVFAHLKNYNILQKYKEIKAQEQDIKMENENHDQTFQKAFRSLLVYQKLIEYCLQILDKHYEDEKLCKIQYGLVSLYSMISTFQNIFSIILSKKSDHHTRNFQNFQKYLDEKVDKVRKIYSDNSFVELFKKISENWKQTSDKLDKNLQLEDEEEEKAQYQQDYMENIQEIQEKLNQLNN